MCLCCCNRIISLTQTYLVIYIKSLKQLSSKCFFLVPPGRWIQIQRTFLDSLDSERHWGTCVLHGVHTRAQLKTTWRNWLSWTAQERCHKEMLWVIHTHTHIHASRPLKCDFSQQYRFDWCLSLSSSSLLDEHCSVPFLMSRSAVDAERLASPSLMNKWPLMMFCSHPRCPRADMQPPLTKIKPRRVSLVSTFPRTH